MAVTFTPTIVPGCGGDRVMAFGTLTLSAVTSGAVASGLQRIEYGMLSRKSVDSTLNADVFFNYGSGGTAINGEIRVRSGTIGDDYHVCVFGN